MCNLCQCTLSNLARRGVAVGTISALAVTLAAGLAGCGDSGVKQITETRPTPNTPAMPSALPPAMGAPASSSSYTWTMPTGWKELPLTQFRKANFQVAGNPDAECYLTPLPGGGGGVEANINRWRNQMGLPPMAADEFAKLAKKQLLGKDATYAEFEGTYKGMSGTENKAGFKMIGLILEDGGNTVFVKMTGPAAVVDQEKANFDAFCLSVKEAAGGTPTASNLPEGHPSLGNFQVDNQGGAPQLPAGHPAIGGGAMPQGDKSPLESSLTWQAPDGWQRAGGERPMRVVTYSFGGKAECYIAVLNGVAGGTDANINRWRGQLGQPALDAAALAALPKIKVLDKDVPLVEIEGDYEGMDGQKNTGYMMYGTIRELEGESLFVKLIGPASEVRDQKDKFIAFSQSIAK